MNKKTRLLITGSFGLLGSAFQRIDTSEYDTIFVGRKDYDLTSENQVVKMFEEIRPEWVINTAALVGGVLYNSQFGDKLFYDNIMMNTLVLHYAKEFSVKKLVAFISTCSYPSSSVTIEEDHLHLAPPHHTNTAYACTKRALDIQINSYRKRYGLNFYSLIPSNIFGLSDNFDAEAGHAVSSLINKAHKAKKDNTHLNVFGDGSQQREFVFADDIARATMKIIKKDHNYDKIIVSNGNPIQIKELVKTLAQIYDLPNDRIIYDTSKPSGLAKRSCCTDRLKSLLPDFQFTDHKVALKLTADWYNTNYPNVRGVQI